jgi:hypothetical protein
LGFRIDIPELEEYFTEVQVARKGNDMTRERDRRRAFVRSISTMRGIGKAICTRQGSNFVGRSTA